MNNESVKKSPEKSVEVLEGAKMVKQKICIKNQHVYNNCYGLRSRAIKELYTTETRCRVLKTRESQYSPSYGLAPKKDSLKLVVKTFSIPRSENILYTEEFCVSPENALKCTKRYIWFNLMPLVASSNNIYMFENST